MKIEKVEVFGVAVPLIGEYKNAYLSKSVQKSVVVRITASGGVTGLGNIDPTPGYSKEETTDHLQVLQTRLAPKKDFAAVPKKVRQPEEALTARDMDTTA